MKKIIDGRRYDTETAERIAEYEFGTSGDHHRVYESLYRTPRGRFFIEYAGGPMSKYAVSNGPHLVSGSSGIIPLSADEAREWCERHDVSADTIAQYFEVEDA